MTEKNKETITFEEAMDKLEGIVGKLENGDVPLEKAINLFQAGMEMSKVCHDKLKEVEGKMDRLMGEDGVMEGFSMQEAEKRDDGTN